MEASQHDRSQFVTCHLLALLILSGIGFYNQPIGAVSLTIPALVAILPLALYYAPAVSEQATRTCVFSTGIAVFVALGIYVAWFGTLMLLLQGFKFGG